MDTYQIVWFWGSGNFCDLLRPLIKILSFLVPYGYTIIKIKKNS